MAKTTAAIKAAVAAENAPAPAVPPGQAAQRAAENTARASAQRAAQRRLRRPLPVRPARRGGPATAGTREPTEDEKAAARRLARALRNATIGQRAAVTTTSATPPGRLKMRQAMAGSAQRAAGALPTAEPFSRTTRRRVPAPPLQGRHRLRRVRLHDRPSPARSPPPPGSSPAPPPRSPPRPPPPSPTATPPAPSPGPATPPPA